MKQMSLKIKLTLLYTFFMILVTCAALGILLSLSSREILSATQTKLEKRVQDSTDYLKLADGELEIDSEFYTVSQDIYLSLYDENLYFLYGKIPYGFNALPQIEDGRTRTIRDGDIDWYVYDMSFRLAENYTVYIRGVTSLTDAEEGYMVTTRFALILLPVLIVLTAVIGYRFTRRTLLPVKEITRTVREIRADADLSRRVGLHTGHRQDEISELAATFDEMLGELDQVFQREKQFTSDVSHVLRTPISVILAQCGTCLEMDDLTEEQRKQIRVIEKKAKEMAAMTAQLLFLSRADQGRQHWNPERLNLSELTQVAVEEQQFLAKEQGRRTEIVCRCQPDIYAEVDETLYLRLLENLISTAVYYGKEDGRVEIFLESDGRRVRGRVTDDGIGIAPENLERIWERFYRADTSRTGEGHSGLGLSMVRWIVRTHGGEIYVKSRLGEGSTFIFEIPVKNEKK